HIGARRLARVLLAPAPGVTANCVVTALVAERPQLLENPNERQPLARWLAAVLQKQGIKPIAPRPDLRLGLDIPFIAELRRLRTDDLPNHLPRNAKVAANRLDRHLPREIRRTNFGYRLHDQHLDLGLPNNQEACVDPYPRGPDWMPITPKTGSLFHADSHADHRRGSSATAASDPQPDRQRHRGDERTERRAARLASQHRKCWAERDSGRGAGFGSGAAARKPAAPVRRLLHDQGQRNGNGAVDLPVDH